jgi:hypothetical protein
VVTFLIGYAAVMFIGAFRDRRQSAAAAKEGV